MYGLKSLFLDGTRHADSSTSHQTFCISQRMLGSPVPLGGQTAPFFAVGAKFEWGNAHKKAVPAGVEALTALVSLQSLNLMRCTRVSDVGAGHLRGLPALACVNLSECPCLSRDALDTLSWHVQVRLALMQQLMPAFKAPKQPSSVVRVQLRLHQI